MHETRSSPRRGRHLAVGLLTGALIAVTAYSVYFRAAYGTWDFTGGPDRVDLTGCRFYRYSNTKPVTWPPEPLRVIRDNPWPLPDVLLKRGRTESDALELYVRTWDGRLWRLGAAGRA